MADTYTKKIIFKSNDVYFEKILKTKRLKQLKQTFKLPKKV